LSGVVRSNNASQVTLVISPALTPGQAFTVDVSGVMDLAANPNTGNSSTNGRVQNYTPLDVGAPGVGGSSFSCKPGEIDVFAGGADIWNTSDQAHLTLTPRSGNFDLKLRVQSLSRSGADNSAKGGLMIRETFDAGSRSLQYLVTPPASIGGRDIYEAGQRSATLGATGPWTGGPD